MVTTAQRKKAEYDAFLRNEAAYCKEHGHGQYGCDTSISVIGKDGATLMPLTEIDLISYHYSDSPEEFHVHDADKTIIDALAEAIRSDSECKVILTKVSGEYEAILEVSSNPPNMNNLPMISSEPTQNSITATQPAYKTVETYITCQFVYQKNAIHTLRGHLESMLHTKEE